MRSNEWCTYQVANWSALRLHTSFRCRHERRMALLLDCDYYQCVSVAKGEICAIRNKSYRSMRVSTWVDVAKLGFTTCGVGIWCTGPVRNWEMGCAVGIACWLTTPLGEPWKIVESMTRHHQSPYLMTVRSSSFPERVISIFASWWLMFVTFRLLIEITWSPALKPHAWAGVSGLTLERRTYQ